MQSKIKLEATKTCNFSAVMQDYTVLCIEIMHDVVLVQSYLVLCIRMMHGLVLVQCYILPCIDKILMVLMMHDTVLLQSCVLHNVFGLTLYLSCRDGEPGHFRPFRGILGRF